MSLWTNKPVKDAPLLKHYLKSGQRRERAVATGNRSSRIQWTWGGVNLHTDFTAQCSANDYTCNKTHKMIMYQYCCTSSTCIFCPARNHFLVSLNYFDQAGIKKVPCWLSTISRAINQWFYEGGLSCLYRARAQGCKRTQACGWCDSHPDADQQQWQEDRRAIASIQCGI